MARSAPGATSMKLSDLLTDPSTGRMSESKLWLHPAKLAYIWAFIHMTLNGGMTEPLLLAFCVPLLAHETISRVVGIKIAGAKEAARDA